MKIGGPAYKGFAFTKAPSGKRNREEFFMGQRRSPKGYEYIVAIPGEICKLFVFDFLKNSNLLNGKWQITRLDLQLTLGYEFADDNQLMLLYWNFYKNQPVLEKKGKKNKVKFTANDAYLLVSVGSKKRDQNQWKVYSSTEDGHYPKEIGVRFEVTLKNSSQYLNCLGESDGWIEKCNFRILQRSLLEADETFLLSKHRSLVKDWSCYLLLKRIGKNQGRRSTKGTEGSGKADPTGIPSWRPGSQRVHPSKKPLFRGVSIGLSGFGIFESNGETQKANFLP